MSFNQTEKCTDESINSDMAMHAAAQAYQDILFRVQTSCLNYHLQLSPFSAIISLKRSFAKSKSGEFFQQPLPSTMQEDIENEKKIVIEHQKVEIEKLQNELVQLKLKYESSLQTNETLEHALAIKKEALPIVENHHYENEMQPHTNCDNNLFLQVNKLKAQLGDSESKNKASEEKLNKLKLEFNANKSNHQQEIISLKKEQNAQVKSLEKQLKSKEKLISRQKNANTYSAVENITSPSASHSKVLAPCQTDNHPCEQEKLILRPKNANSFSAVENVTSLSTSNFKALAPCQTDNLPCEQENETIENDMSNIDTEDTEDDDQEISGEMMDYALDYFKKWIARLDKEDQT